MGRTKSRHRRFSGKRGLPMIARNRRGTVDGPREKTMKTLTFFWMGAAIAAALFWKALEERWDRLVSMRDEIHGEGKIHG